MVTRDPTHPGAPGLPLALLLPLLLTLPALTPAQAWGLEVSVRHDRSLQLDRDGWAVVGALRAYSSYYGPLPHGECERAREIHLVRYRWARTGLACTVDGIVLGLRWYYSAHLFGPSEPGVPEPFERSGGSLSTTVSVPRGEVSAVGALWARIGGSYRSVPVLAVRSDGTVRLVVLDERPRVLELGTVEGDVVLSHSLLEVRRIEGRRNVTVPPPRIVFVDSSGRLVEVDPIGGGRRVLARVNGPARVWGWIAGGYLVTVGDRTLLVLPSGEVRKVEVPRGWRVLALPGDDYLRKWGFLVLASGEGLAVGRLEGSIVRVLTPALRVPADVRLAWLTPWHWPGYGTVWSWEPEGSPQGFMMALWRGSEVIVAAWHRGSPWRVRRVAFPGPVGSVIGVAIGASERRDARSVSLVFVPTEGRLSVYRLVANVTSPRVRGRLPVGVLPAALAASLLAVRSSLRGPRAPAGPSRRGLRPERRYPESSPGAPAGASPCR